MQRSVKRLLRQIPARDGVAEEEERGRMGIGKKARSWGYKKED